MKKHSIVSRRKFETWPSWHVVFEWEDIMKETMNLELECIPNNIKRKLKDFLWYKFKISHKFKLNKNNWKLIWAMNSKAWGLYNYKNCIPIFLDTPVSSLDAIKRATKHLPIFFVTCLDFYNMLRKKGVNNVKYIPLSISDKYITSKIPEKEYDVLQFGRKNEILHNWMLQYCKEHKEVEYIYQTEGGSLTYTSTKKGIIGKFDSRDEYMELMKKAKISLVSSPGCDGSRDFGNIDFITPRFYESAACYCHMIGRYTENEETKIININSICNNVKNYEEFESILKRMLDGEKKIDYEVYKTFLKKNCTSARCIEIEKLIKEKI